MEADQNIRQPSEENFASPMVTRTFTDGQPGQSESRSTMHQGESTQQINIDSFKTAADRLKMLTQTLPQTNDSKSFEARLLALEASMTRLFSESWATSAQQPNTYYTVPRFSNHSSSVHVTTRTHEDYTSQAGRTSVM